MKAEALYQRTRGVSLRKMSDTMPSVVVCFITGFVTDLRFDLLTN